MIVCIQVRKRQAESEGQKMFAIAFAGAIIEALMAVLVAAGALVATLATLAGVIAKAKEKEIRQLTK